MGGSKKPGILFAKIRQVLGKSGATTVTRVLCPYSASTDRYHEQLVLYGALKTTNHQRRDCKPDIVKIGVQNLGQLSQLHDRAL